MLFHYCRFMHKTVVLLAGYSSCIVFKGHIPDGPDLLGQYHHRDASFALLWLIVSLPRCLFSFSTCFEKSSASICPDVRLRLSRFFDLPIWVGECGALNNSVKLSRKCRYFWKYYLTRWRSFFFFLSLLRIFIITDKIRSLLLRTNWYIEIVFNLKTLCSIFLFSIFSRMYISIIYWNLINLFLCFTHTYHRCSIALVVIPIAISNISLTCVYLQFFLICINIKVRVIFVFIRVSFFTQGTHTSFKTMTIHMCARAFTHICVLTALTHAHTLSCSSCPPGAWHRRPIRGLPLTGGCSTFGVLNYLRSILRDHNLPGRHCPSE